MGPAWLALALAVAGIGVAQQPSPDAPRVDPPRPIETDATRAAAQQARAEVERAQSLRAQKDLTQARDVIRAALDPLLATPGLETSGEIAGALDRLGAEAARLSDPESIVRAYEPCLAYRIATLGPDHIDVQVTRATLGTTYWSLGNLARSEELLSQALDSAKRTLAADDPRIADAQSNYAVTLFRLGRFEEAVELMKETVDALVARHGEDDPEIQWAVANLANFLDKLGDYEGALAMRERVYAILREHRPAEHQDVVIASENLALALRKAGDPVAARSLLQNVLETKQRTLPEGHLSLERTRQNLALSLCGVGDWQSARILLEGVVQRLSKRLPPDDPSIMNAQANLAFMLLGLGEPRAAAAIDEQLLELCRRKYGDDHPLTLEALVTVANDRFNLGEYERSAELGQRVIERLRATGPDDAVLLLRAESRQSNALFQLGRKDEAIALSSSASERWLRRLGPEHPNSCLSRVHLAGMIEDRDRGRSLAMLREVASTLISRMIDPRQVSSAREMELAALEAEPLIGAVLGQCTEAEDPALCLRLIEAARYLAGAGTRSLSALERGCAADPRVRERRDALRRKAAQVAALAHEGSREAYQTAALERGGLEQALLAAVREFGGADSADVTPVAFAARLPPGAAAVSYRRFESEESAPGSAAPKVAARFAAFVLRRDATVVRVDLGPAAAIESAIEAWRAALTGGDDARATSEAARKAILDPVLAAAGEARRLVVVLDDALLTIPLDALALDTGVVGDRIAIEVRSSLSELEEPERASAAADQLVALGGVDFDARADPPEGAVEASESEPAAARARRTSSPRSGGRMAPRATAFAPLPSSESEVTGIAELFRSRAAGSRDVTVLRGADATVEALVAAAPRARYLHVATHGFFAPESVGSPAASREADAFAREVQGLSPRVLCGLALAGANAPEDAVDRTAGILTAEELAHLDLVGCELAVLSACETSTGVRRAGQGLASLRTALHAAGAHTTLTSLWKVSDAATSELMLAFYRGLWVDHLDKATALWRAKDELRKRRAPPRDWAGWVLSGDPE